MRALLIVTLMDQGLELMNPKLKFLRLSMLLNLRAARFLLHPLILLAQATLRL